MYFSKARNNEPSAVQLYCSWRVQWSSHVNWLFTALNQLQSQRALVTCANTTHFTQNDLDSGSIQKSCNRIQFKREPSLKDGPRHFVKKIRLELPLCPHCPQTNVFYECSQAATATENTQQDSIGQDQKDGEKAILHRICRRNSSNRTLSHLRLT